MNRILLFSLRELRSVWVHCVVGLVVGSGLLWIATTSGRSITALQSVDGVRPVAWYFGFLVTLVVSQRIFGREWSGGNRKLLARLPLDHRELFLIKLVMALLLSASATLILVRFNDHLLATMYKTEFRTGKLGPPLGTADMIRVWSLVFGSAILTSLILRQSGSAMVLGAIVVGIYPFLVSVADYHWFAFHDLPEGWAFDIGRHGAAVIGAVMIVTAGVVFLRGRLHRPGWMRVACIVLACSVIFSLAGVVTIERLLAAEDFVTAEDPEMVIGWVNVDPFHEGRLVIDMHRSGKPRPHAVICDLHNMTIEFLPSAIVRPVPIEGSIATVSYLDVPDRVDQRVIEKDCFRIDSSGELVPLDPFRQIFGWWDLPRTVIDDKFVFANPKSSEMEVRTRDGTWLASYEQLEWKCSRRLAGRAWVVPSTWIANGGKVAGVNRIDALSGKVEHFALDRMRVAIDDAFAHGENAEVFYIADDGQSIEGIDLDSKSRRTVYHADANESAVVGIWSSRTGRFLAIAAGRRKSDARLSVLDTRSGRLLDEGQRIGEAIREGLFLPHIRSSPGDGSIVLRADEGTKRSDVLSLPDGRRVATIDCLNDLYRWVDEHRVVTWNKKRVELHDLQSGTTRMIWEVGNGMP